MSKIEIHCYDGVNLKNLTAYFVADNIYYFQSKNLLQKLKHILRIFFIPKLDLIKKNNDSLYSFSIDRNDYSRLADSYIRKLDKNFDEMDLGSSNGLKFKFSITVLKKVFGLSKKLKSEGMKTKDCLIFIHSAVQSLSYYEELKKIPDLATYKTHLSFNSSYYYESVLTTYMRANGITTLSMQHGMYYKFQNDPPFEMIGMFFCPAEYLLAWGEFTKNQLENILGEDTKIIVFGHPLYSQTDGSFNKSPSRTSEEKVLVLLPRITYKNEIFSLLRILKHETLLGYRFIIRPHPSLKNILKEIPSNNINFELSMECFLEDEFKQNISCVIGFNTTTLFESTIFSKDIIQYISGNDEFKNVGFTEFDDPFSLKSHLAKSYHEKSTTLDHRYYFGA